ncbi:hypothetical protein D5S18_16005 [Nocardia panacis]|uniref:Uncharacterized protein n=1 Tax=Nocardia panacis TaxID=2340916 RepID=A0A3A4K4Q5_9NOCA|nr:hypothetical protein D5S18_16005 [Nocardia panacis]
MRVQEAGVTQPRPPTVAEARARDRARKKAEEDRLAEEAAETARKRKRKRTMIGGVAVVGVAALVGGGYLAYRTATEPKYQQVTAQCSKVLDGKETVVDDNNCGPGRQGFVDDSTGYHPGGPGFIFLPGIPQYHYYYGGSGVVGSPPSGGTFTRPDNAQITTKSGTTVQRGGLGSKSGGGS